jgi:KUP system potassium uptake protein
MVPLDAFLADIHAMKPHRVRGSAVFLTGNSGGVPLLLLHHFKHNQVLHETILLLTITSEHTPFVKPTERLGSEQLGEGFYRVVARFGYMETPSVPTLIEALHTTRAVPLDMDRLTYYLGRETLIPCGRGLRRFRMWLFALISRNALPATAYFGIPPNRVVELGMQIEL